MSEPGQLAVERSPQEIGLSITVARETNNYRGASSKEAVGAPRSFRVIRLRYADVSEIAGIIGPENANIAPTDQFIPNSAFTGSPASGIQSFQGGYQSTLQGAGLPLGQQDPQHAPYGQRIDASIAIDRRLNAILLSGSTQDVEQYAAIIEAVDIPSRSVTLEAQIVELTDTGARNVGILVGNGTAAAQASLTVQTSTLEQAGNGI